MGCVCVCAYITYTMITAISATVTVTGVVRPLMVMSIHTLFLRTLNTPKPTFSGALTQSPFGELTAFPRSLSW